MVVVIDEDEGAPHLAEGGDALAQQPTGAGVVQVRGHVEHDGQGGMFEAMGQVVERCCRVFRIGDGLAAAQATVLQAVRDGPDPGGGEVAGDAGAADEVQGVGFFQRGDGDAGLARLEQAFQAIEIAAWR